MSRKLSGTLYISIFVSTLFMVGILATLSLGPEASSSSDNCCTKFTIIQAGAIRVLNTIGPNGDPGIREPLEKALSYTANCSWQDEKYGCN